MTRVLVIEASGDLWGNERALLDVLDRMPGLELAVCCPPERPMNGELAKREVRTLPYYVYGLQKKSKFHRLRAAVGVLRACIEFRPDVLYVNQGGSYKVVLPAATLLDLPIVAGIRLFDDIAYLGRIGPSPRRLRGLVADSSSVGAEIQRFRELAPIACHTIYDPYFASLAPPILTERLSQRIAYVGRLVPIKGVDILVDAMEVLNSRDDTLECVIAGDGDARFIRDLKQTAARGRSAAMIKWKGFVPEVLPLLQTCSVLAVPSHREPLGRVIFEAWDAGVIPVVFSGSGGAAEIISESGGGLLYPDQEPKSLAAGLRKALDLNEEERSRLVDNGRLWVAKNCDPDRCGSALSSVLTNACRTHLNER
jgi:glycosyltransferase involved in cell wall biosynthesis